MQKEGGQARGYRREIFRGGGVALHGEDKNRRESGSRYEAVVEKAKEKK